MTKRVMVGLAISFNLLCLISFLFGILIYLLLTGIIPQFADTSPSSDYLGYQPSFGRVWEYGFGCKYYRMHLKPSSYGRLELVVLLTDQTMPKIAESAPWWWGAKPDGKTTILIGAGKGPDGKYYEIYDPSRELLFTYDD